MKLAEAEALKAAILKTQDAENALFVHFDRFDVGAHKVLQDYRKAVTEQVLIGAQIVTRKALEDYL